MRRANRVDTTHAAIVVTIPGTPPSRNVVDNYPLRRRIAEVKEWRERAAMCALVQLGSRARRPLPGRPIVTVRYFFARAGRRDRDNFAPKRILDGLRRVGLLRDDSDVAIDLRPVEFFVDRERPRTEITLEAESL